MQTSEKIDQISAALVKAQAEVKYAFKDAENDFFRSRYADMRSIWDACKEALAKNNCAVLQGPGGDGDVVTLTTRIIHQSGQWFQSTLGIKLHPQPNRKGELQPVTPQQVGSAITYARRYGLAAMVGVIADDDDDGNAASGRYQTMNTQPAPAAQADAGMVDALRKEIASADRPGLSRIASKIMQRFPDGHPVRAELLPVWQQRDAELKAEAKSQDTTSQNGAAA